LVPMNLPENDDHEVNQLRWWSHWSELIWFSGQCYAILSRDFDEPLFNHSEFMDPKAYGNDLLREIESKFRSEGIPPSFFLRESEGYRTVEGGLSANGYRVIDQLSVMEITSPSFDGNAEIIPVIIGEAEVERWCETYLLSFYGEKGLLGNVVGIAERALKDHRVKLILAMHDGVPVGTLALYETENICGVYCVGTILSYRQKGVASRMIKFAYELSREKAKRLGLQTFLSDSLEGYYIDRGFKRMYLKDVFVKL